MWRELYFSLYLSLTSSVYPHQLSSACSLNRLCVELLTHYDKPSIGASALFVCLQTATD